MVLKANDTAAILVDVQEKLMPVLYNREMVDDAVKRLVKGLRVLEVPIIVTQQYTKGIGMTTQDIIDVFEGEFSYMEKDSFGVYGEPAIKEAIDNLGKKNILVFGTETHVCVLQTCLQLKEAGYQPVLVINACGSRHEIDRLTAIERAKMEGILVTTAESVLFELTDKCTNPKFRQISKIVK